MGDADLSYIEEDLRSPCTQEIAVFNAFAEIVAKADDQVGCYRHSTDRSYFITSEFYTKLSHGSRTYTGKYISCG